MNVAVMGYGTIGSGVVEALEKNQDVIAKSAGEPVLVKYVLDLRDFPGDPVQEKIVHDFQVIVGDDTVGIVVETMGGLNPAYPFAKACLEAGKHVVTSNKALVAAHGTELLAIAREKQVNFLFEASVGGGIPIIRPMYRCLMGEHIEEITGILNGTTNFILTKMDKEGESFTGALKEAQNLGYAERNPEADVEGHDACRKIAILTAMATGKEVSYEDIYTEGITKITDIDFKYADLLGMSVKLFATSRIGNGQVHAWVVPMMVGQDHPLYAVSGVYNAVMVKGNMLGISMFYGSGAGKLPTASAVAADVIEAVKNPNRNIPIGWSSVKQVIAPMDTSEHRYFVRIAGTSQERKAAVREVFDGAKELQLEGMHEFAVLTKVMTEGAFKKAVERLDEGGEESFIRQTIRACV